MYLKQGIVQEDAYRSSWEHGNHEETDMTATWEEVDNVYHKTMIFLSKTRNCALKNEELCIKYEQVDKSASMFDVMAIYLAVSAHGVTTHTVTMDL